MTASDLVAALEPVAAAFEALGIAYFLGGSVASSAHGVARASLDADIVAEIEPAHVDREGFGCAATDSREDHRPYRTKTGTCFSRLLINVG